MFKHILNRLNKIYMNHTLRKNKKIIFNGNFHIIGNPLIQVKEDALITIGNNVTLGSSNTGYHLNMFAPVKLFADRPGAKITIGNNTRIYGSCIHAWSTIEIGDNCLIAANCQIADSNAHETLMDAPENRIASRGDNPAPIKIFDNVWIGTGSIILKGVTIGEGSVISAGSVVTEDIPPFVIARGNPAKVIEWEEIR